MTSIEIIAIAYGKARYGRSCANCNYLDKKVIGIECGLHCLPTGLANCCGTWSGARVKAEPEKQAELF